MGLSRYSWGLVEVDFEDAEAVDGVETALPPICMNDIGGDGEDDDDEEDAEDDSADDEDNESAVERSNGDSR